MKKPWLVACALFAVMATAMAADTTPAKPLSVAPIIITPEEKAKAEAARALAKIRANDARKRLLAKRQKEIDRKARANNRAAAQATAAAAAAATVTTPVTAAPAKPAATRTIAATSKPSVKKPGTATTAAKTATATAVAMTTQTPAVARPPSAPDSTAVTRSPRKAVPKGFEEWFAPQKTAVDLYYGGRYLMTTLVEYTLDHITFLNPPEIAAHMPGIRSATEFSVLLADAKPTNSDKVCVRPNQPLCGRLEPATVGVIFDETRFRADLFAHPSLLLEIQKAGKQYLPEPAHTEKTLVQNLGVLYSGSSEGTDRFSLFGRTRVGEGRHHGFSNWVSTDENALGIDELGYTHDMKDTQVTGGLFEPVVDALRAVSRQPIIGVGYARSLITRTDMESVLASPIELFLPTRGRVDIFRDGRLISTGFHEAGNQSIDTSRLPAGAYNIDIVITDVAGTTRTIQQLFIKSTLMAPPGEPLWFVDAGQVMQRNTGNGFPDDYGTMQLRGGYRWREKDWLGFGTAAALTENESLVELSSGLLFDWLEGSGEIYGSSAGGSGFGLRGLTRHKQLVVSASIQHTSQDDPGSPGEYRLLPSDQNLDSLNISHPLWRGLLTGSLIHREDTAGYTSERTTLGYTVTLPLRATQSLLVQAEVGKDAGNAIAMLTLQWRNTHGKWYDTAQLQSSKNNASGNGDGVTASAGTTWRDGNSFVDDVEVSANAEAGDQRQSLTFEAQHLSQFGRGKLGLAVTSMDGANQSISSLGYDTNIVVGEHGKTVFGGGPNMNESAVLIDLGNTTDALLEVSADGQPQFIARGGRMAALTLPPYHQYRIQLKDTGLALTQFDNQAREVSLYPGHVVNLDWKIQSVQVLLGRIITADGLPVKNARIDGAEGPAFTDEEGYLQTEINSLSKELKVRVAGNTCTIILPTTATKDSVIRAGDMLCTMTGATQAPPAPETTAPPP